jgi:hypothetical protein
MMFFWLCIPELKGRTLEEVDELFAKQVPARMFKSYVTTIQEEALAELRSHEAAGEKDPAAETVEDRRTGSSG